MRIFCLIFGLGLAFGLVGGGQDLDFEKDVFPTEKGDLEIYSVGHGTLFLKFDGLNIHIDPVGDYADYSRMPKADLVLVTHEHGDHLDNNAIAAIGQESSSLIFPEDCVEIYRGDLSPHVMNNGDSHTWEKGIIIQAIPAYNIKHVRGPDMPIPFHPKGVGNGYILNLGGKRVYIAGDTENTPEMKALEDIDIAFLPMNVPYTMTPEMVADAALAFRPKVLFPYHYGNTDTSKLVDLLKGSGIDVRIRDLQ
jgi:L-ascorbate metabolism protein UlaG (beta-lactamase superfamily)